MESTMEGFIKFFGTGGARFVVSKQLRATGGLWFHYKDTNLYIDPGPGALVRINTSDEVFNPAHLDGIILTHKHVDHTNDVNVLIEAMTEGGFKKRGILFCPEDAIQEDPVVLKFARNYLDGIQFLKEKRYYILKDIPFTVPVRHIHPVETYGIIFDLNPRIGLLTDTRFFDTLPEHYRVDCLIVNVLRLKPVGQQYIIDHLSVQDFIEVVTEVKPEVAIMTHFGMNIIEEGPEMLAERLQKETGIRIIAAYDGMKWEF
ncbi:MAG TPA: MBL fold hydrolase [Deltaproteobacteria bacterium]|nr:MBL fold hydrolase [Deltaproteobacteria bacterium]